MRKIPVILIAIIFFLLSGKEIFAAYTPYTNEVIVYFKNQPNASMLSAMGTEQENIVTLSHAVSDTNAMVYTIKADTTVPEAISQLKQDPNVETVIPNYRFQKLTMPNDPGIADTPAAGKPRKQWNMYQLKLAGTDSVNDPGGWDLTSGSSDVVVAVIDDGVNSSHEDLSGKFHSLVDCSGTSCLTVNSMSPFSPTDDHGSHVAGLAAAATNNGKGIAGAGYNSKIMMIKVAGSDGSMTFDAVVNALHYAGDHGARVINMSFGILEENIDTDGKNELQAGVNYAWGKGALPVAAAGNCGSNTQGVEACAKYFYNPVTRQITIIGYATNSKFYPAASQNVLSVAATKEDGSLAPYSEHNDGSNSAIGNWISVAAPGGDCISEQDMEYCVLSTYGNNQYHYMSGTSMASPQVAGVAALLFAVKSDLTNSQAKQIIEDTANSSIAAGATNKGGVNALSAVRTAQGATPGAPTATPTVPAGAATATPTVTSVPTVTPYPTSGQAVLPRQPPSPYPTGVICPSLTSCPRKIEGDANCDGQITLEDITPWAANYDKIVISAQGGAPVGNPNFYCLEGERVTHFIDMLDFEVVRRNALQ